MYNLNQLAAICQEVRARLTGSGVSPWPLGACFFNPSPVTAASGSCSVPLLALAVHVVLASVMQLWVQQVGRSPRTRCNPLVKLLPCLQLSHRERHFESSMALLGAFPAHEVRAPGWLDG
jgi:hypothetical protein